MWWGCGGGVVGGGAVECCEVLWGGLHFTPSLWRGLPFPSLFLAYCPPTGRPTTSRIAHKSRETECGVRFSVQKTLSFSTRAETHIQAESVYIRLPFSAPVRTPHGLKTKFLDDSLRIIILRKSWCFVPLPPVQPSRHDTECRQPAKKPSRF